VYAFPLFGSLRTTTPTATVNVRKRQMDFAVPDTAGSGPADPALLRARGADPLVSIPAAHFFHNIAGLPLQPIPGTLSPIPNALPYSIVEAILGPILVVDTSTLGTAASSPLLCSLITPAKFEAALAQSFMEAPNVRIEPGARYSSLNAAAAAVVEFANRRDATALHPAYVLASSDVFSTEPVLGTTPAPSRQCWLSGPGRRSSATGRLPPARSLGW